LTVLYPGSFDPVTLGHVDVTWRAARLFDKVVIGVYDTPSKSLMFDTDERMDLFRRAVTDIPNVEVTSFQGLVVRYAQEIGANSIVRGLRSGSDFEYEFDMAFMNRRLAPDIDLVSFMTSLDYMFLSSSLIKEVAMLGGDITGMVPPHVIEAVNSKFSSRV
jgi:pantetheine-phosphate adenylyltransferase